MCCTPMCNPMLMNPAYAAALATFYLVEKPCINLEVRTAEGYDYRMVAI